MFFCASLAIGLVKSGKVQSINMDQETFMKYVACSFYKREGVGVVAQLVR